MEWIISANHNKYDHSSAFKKWNFIDWKQGNYSFKPGDIVYIYSTSPYKTIRYKTIVSEINKNSSEIVDDSIFWSDKNKHKKALKGKYMRLKLLETYDSRNLDLDVLLKNGLKSAPQGPQKLRKQLKNYLDSLNANILYPEILDESELGSLYEGAKKTITVNAYERNPIARQKCIDYYGYNCIVCGINFEKVYGEIGKNFIHVHHIIPISEIDKNYKVNPKTDLIPVCPNCHAMLHRGLKFKM